MIQTANQTNLNVAVHPLKGYLEIYLYTLMGTFLGYLGTGVLFHWIYYKKKRDSPETWKCQPNKWSPPQLELRGTLLGSFTTLWASAIWAALATYIINDGDASKVYFNHQDAGYTWLLLQLPVVVITMDYVFYWQHRLYHVPWMYKHFHKVHHVYKQPTVFSAHAFHPIEHLSEIMVIICPVFLVPMYWANLLGFYIYMFIHGILNHSGINFSSFWWMPLRPDTKFHDLHHQYTHVNYAFFISYWDQLHGTTMKQSEMQNVCKNK